MDRVPIFCFIAGLLTATGLMVFDEILTLAIYCHECKYQIPFLGTFALYDAEGFAWTLILLGTVLLLSSLLYIQRKRLEEAKKNGN